jgi:4-amino-4-deoxy-L-arabinose transferase-like glycosyltransferase
VVQSPLPLLALALDLHPSFDAATPEQAAAKGLAFYAAPALATAWLWLARRQFLRAGRAAWVPGLAHAAAFAGLWAWVAWSRFAPWQVDTWPGCAPDMLRSAAAVCGVAGVGAGLSLVRVRPAEQRHAEPGAAADRGRR